MTDCIAAPTASQRQVMATILIVEDDLNFARLVEKIMIPHGHRIMHADTALGGMNLAASEKIDLVLLDMDLPDLDGKVVATSLKARAASKGVPIIAVTARADGATERLARAFGCDGFIAKPIDTRAFPGQVAAYL